MYASAVGFSGVLFCYAVIEANHTFEVSRRIFGMFDVPAKLTPFVLLVLLQILIPNISMVGHLAGVIFGLFSVSGGINILMPSKAFMEHIELEVSPFSTFSRLSSYVRHTNKSLVASSAGEGMNMLGTYTCNILALPLHMIGFPTERCCECLEKCLSTTTKAISTLFLCGSPEVSETGTLLPLPRSHTSLVTTSSNTTTVNLPVTNGNYRSLIEEEEAAEGDGIKKPYNPIVDEV
jgi:hypothetical protein